MGIREGGDGGPVGFGGGGNMEQADAGRGGAFENLGAVRIEAGVLQVAVGVYPVHILQILSVGRGRRC